MDTDCEVCECDMNNYGWEKYVETKKHRIVCEDIVVAKLRFNVEQGNLEIFEGENSLHVCNICLQYPRNSAEKKSR